MPAVDYYSSYNVIKEAFENQRGQGVCSRPHRCTVAEPGFEPRAPGYRAQAVASRDVTSLDIGGTDASPQVNKA